MATKYRVCPHCEGEGTIPNPAIGAFTGEDMDEWYADDWDAREDFVSEYTRRGGAYDVICPTCTGQRVVLKGVRVPEREFVSSVPRMEY